MSSAAGQLVGTGKLNLGSAFEAGAIAAITAGLMNGITYSAESGLGFTTQPVTAGAGTQTLANLSGVKPVVGTVTNQATTAVTVDLGTRGLAMLAGGVSMRAWGRRFGAEGLAGERGIGRGRECDRGCECLGIAGRGGDAWVLARACCLGVCEFGGDGDGVRGWGHWRGGELGVLA